jgi:imidazole glycerol phosphate synthase subunit HisF
MSVLLEDEQQTRGYDARSAIRVGKRWDLNVIATTGEGNVLDLGSVTTTGDTDTDVEAGELVEADNEQGLVDLER